MALAAFIVAAAFTQKKSVRIMSAVAPQGWVGLMVVHPTRMVSLVDVIATLCAEHPYKISLVVDRGTYWFFPNNHETYGSCGFIIDKQDGHWHGLGSGLPAEKWFWAHERGIKHRAYTLVIDDVVDRETTTRFLMHRIGGTNVSKPFPAWKFCGSPGLPSTVPFVAYERVQLWRYITNLMENERHDWFRYHLVVRECEYTNCTYIGQVA